MLRARDVMTKDVVWLNQNKPIREAYNFLKTFSIHHLPIVDDNSRLVGLLSEKDFLRVGHLQENELDLPDQPVKSVMSRDIVSCHPASALGNIAATMIACKIHSVPVVMHNRIVGIVTSSDILEVFCSNEEANGRNVMPFDFLERTTFLPVISADAQ